MDLVELISVGVHVPQLLRCFLLVLLQFTAIWMNLFDGIHAARGLINAPPQRTMRNFFPLSVTYPFWWFSDGHVNLFWKV